MNLPIETQAPNDRPSATVTRRRLLLGTLGLAASGGAGTAFANASITSAVSDASASRRLGRRPLVIDVAARFSTFRIGLPDNVQEPSPIGIPRGSSFLLEGVIFPGGTIVPGELFDLEANLDRHIGQWFCWGNIIATETRPVPHTVSTQEHVFGKIDPALPFPPDKLVSNGMEGSFEAANNPQMRAVTGGSGRYAGATGHAAQFLIGQNTDTDPNGLESSTLRFVLDVRRPGRFASPERLARWAGLG